MTRYFEEAISQTNLEFCLDMRKSAPCACFAHEVKIEKDTYLEIWLQWIQKDILIEKVIGY